MIAVHVDALEHVWISVQATVGQLENVPIVPNKRVQTTIAATVHHTLCIENRGIAGTAIVCTGCKIPGETRTLFQSVLTPDQVSRILEKLKKIHADWAIGKVAVDTSTSTMFIIQNETDSSFTDNENNLYKKSTCIVSPLLSRSDTVGMAIGLHMSDVHHVDLLFTDGVLLNESTVGWEWLPNDTSLSITNKPLLRPQDTRPSY